MAGFTKFDPRAGFTKSKRQARKVRGAKVENDSAANKRDMRSRKQTRDFMKSKGYDTPQARQAWERQLSRDRVMRENKRALTRKRTRYQDLKKNPGSVLPSPYNPNTSAFNVGNFLEGQMVAHAARRENKKRMQRALQDTGKINVQKMGTVPFGGRVGKSRSRAVGRAYPQMQDQIMLGGRVKTIHYS